MQIIDNRWCALCCTAGFWHGLFGDNVKRLFYILAGMLLSGAVAAQPYPNKPIKFVVPFAPGGNLDFIARVIQPKLAEYLGVPVVIDNKPGASGIIGAAYAAGQPADGYTIFLGNTGTNAIYTATYDKLPYDPAKDFVAIGRTSTSDFLAVIHPSIPAKTLKEFIAYAKANPGKLNAAVTGVGSSNHFATELIRSKAEIDMLMVPYKGSAPGLQDVLGGQVHLLVDAPTVSMESVKAGRLVGLAVTGKKRLASLPDVPTFDEAGLLGVEASGFQGIFVPTATPPAIVSRLSDALVKAMNQPDVRERFLAQGIDAAPMDSREFGAFVQGETVKWAKLAKSANIKATD
jgi:tripartite-type tricarboxylate transporter receptor subunit TctC